MGDLEITFMGVGDAFASGGACWNGFLVNRTILFEAPPQALMSVQRAGVDPNDIEVVVISHHHGDHFYGLPMLMLWWRWNGRKKPLRIVAPANTERITRDIARETFPWLFDISYELEWIVAEPGCRLELPGLAILPLEMVHDATINVCLGFQAEIDGRRLGYTGDTVYCPSVEKLALWSEIMIAECVSITPNPVHMDFANDIPRVRALLPEGRPLILTHLGVDVAASTPMPGVSIAEEQKTYRF